MPCLAPSEILTPTVASTFGLFAETIISRKYLLHRGKSAFFPASTTDFQDISAGFGNTNLYIAFLKSHHPGLKPSQIQKLSAASLVKIPDLLTNDGGVNEYYEIKPNSIDGVADGFTKLAFLDALYASFALPYRGGSRWRASDKISLFKGTVMGYPIEVTFEFFRKTNGLVVYHLCIYGVEKLALDLIIAILAVVVVVLLARIAALAAAAAIVIA